MKKRLTILSVVLSVMVTTSVMAKTSDDAVLEQARKEYYEYMKKTGQQEKPEKPKKEKKEKPKKEKPNKKDKNKDKDNEKSEEGKAELVGTFDDDTNWIKMDLYEPEPTTPLEKTEKELKDMRRKLNFYQRVIRSVEREEEEIRELRKAAEQNNNIDNKGEKNEKVIYAHINYDNIAFVMYKYKTCSNKY